MSELNLTSRKNSPPPKVLGTFVKDRNENGDITYKVRYSEAYREEGHDWNKSFKVLRGAYWFKYQILDQDDIATYETLQFLCEREIPFTLDKLAETTGIGKATLRARLDNLENAELLEITKSDGQGSPNTYILRTPLFERDAIVNDSPAAIGRQNKILKAYGELPQIFIDDEAERLRRKVRKNRVQKLRKLYKEKKFQQRNKSLWNQLKNEFESKKLVWHSIVKKIGAQKAAALDNLVWRLAKSDLSNLESIAFNRIIRERIKDYLKKIEIIFDSFFVDTVEKLFHFYSPRMQPATASPRPANRATERPSAAAPPQQPATATAETLKEEQHEFLRSILDARRTGENLIGLPKSLEDFTKIFRDSLRYLSADELNIYKDYFTADEWQKLTTELKR